MARPFNEVRKLMFEYGYTNDSLGRELGISTRAVSSRLNCHYPWLLSEMWKFLELTNQPPHRLHEIFPKDGINEPGIKRRIGRRPA